MTGTLLLLFAAVFLGTFPLAFSIRRAWHSRRIRHRISKLGGDAGGASEAAASRVLRQPGHVEQVLSRLPVTASLRRRVQRSGVEVSTANFLLLTGTLSGTGFVTCYIWRNSAFLACATALALASLPFLYLVQRKKRRDALFAEQLPDALTMIARSLRAGHSLASAVELGSMELPNPTGGLLKLAFEQQNLGVRMVDALVSLRTRIDSEDFNFFVTIISINSESGGNLSEILDKLAETIRARLQIRRQVEVLTAEGRISGYILVALPVVMFGIFYIIRPGYLDVFFTERICQFILGAALLVQAVGYLFIRKIVNISI